VEARVRQALDCEQSSIELATAPFNPGMSLTSGIFKADKDANVVPIYAENLAKTM
jgi:hypothetical protein